MTVMKITLLSTLALWCYATQAADALRSPLPIEQRFAQNVTNKKDCASALRWRDGCQERNTPTLWPAFASFSAASADAQARLAFAETHRSLLARFTQE